MAYKEEQFNLFHPMVIPFGPFDMLISNAGNLTRGSLSFKHRHDNTFELHYVVKGDSVLVANNVRYELHEGQICWVNPGSSRYVETSPSEDHLHFVIHFELNPCQDRECNITLEYDDISTFLSSVSRQPVWIDQKRVRYDGLFGLICTELEGTRFGHMIIVRNMLCSFITHAIQNLGAAQISDNAYRNQPDSMIHSIISYTRNHYSEDLTIATVAAELKISERHLTRLLREKYNTTFNNLLASFRIARVQEYLALGTYSLEEISEATGFSSVSVMRSNFKKITGRTVGEYRDSLK